MGPYERKWRRILRGTTWTPIQSSRRSEEPFFEQALSDHSDVFRERIVEKLRRELSGQGYAAETADDILY